MLNQYYQTGLPRWLSGKNSSANAGDVGSISGLGRYPGEGNNNPLPCFFAWRIPWTEGPGRLQSKRSQRVGHSLSRLVLIIPEKSGQVRTFVLSLIQASLLFCFAYLNDLLICLAVSVSHSTLVDSWYYYYVVTLFLVTITLQWSPPLPSFSIPSLLIKLPTNCFCTAPFFYFCFYLPIQNPVESWKCYYFVI